jgi:hypothetical protein
MACDEQLIRFKRCSIHALHWIQPLHHLQMIAAHAPNAKPMETAMAIAVVVVVGVGVGVEVVW